MSSSLAEPRWIRAVPRPEVGLPALVAAAAAATVLTIELGLPAGLAAVVAVPVPLLGARWGRAPSYAAIGCIFAAGLAIALLGDGGGARGVQRVAIQSGALALMWEVVHSASHGRRRATHALSASEARYRQLIETLNVVPFELDPKRGRFSYVGPQIERVLGHDPESCLADGFWAERLHLTDRDEAAAAYDAAMASGTGRDFEFCTRNASGDTVWIHEIVLPAPDDSGPPRLRGVLVDVTARHEVEAARQELEARDAQKLASLELLAGSVAHDFNNLLTAILGNAAVLLDQLPEPHPGRERVEDVVVAARRGAELTRQMLAYTGRASREIQTRDLSEIVRETAQLLASGISKSARLEVEHSPHAWVRADAGQLHQVVMNLVMNASDALEGEEGTIRVRVGTEEPGERDGGTRTFLEVEDDGVGMAPDAVRGMFDPFFTTKVQGRGLGLAVVQGIVRAHGGDIDVRTAPGEGTAIRVRLPLATEPVHEEAAQKPRPRPVPRAAEGCILVADDEPQVRNVLRMLLESSGYEVLEADDGVEALNVVRRLSGAETLRTLRAFRPDLPVLLTSGYAEEEFSELRAHGRVGFLGKPFRRRDLSERLADLLAT